MKAVIVTHAHIDHTRSLRKVAESFTIEHFVDSGLHDKMGGTNVRWVCDQIEQGHLGSCQRREVVDSAITGLPSRTGLSDQHIDPVSCPTCDPRIRILSGQLEEDP
jgi:phosphoribosyl 1,2-cyclic phosphodiesterase